MKSELKKSERYAVLELLDEQLNSIIAPELKAELVSLAKEQVENLILDLKAVKFVDSSGLSAILTGNRLWNGGNGSFVLTGIDHPTVRKLIEISRLDTVLNIVPTVSESVDFVMMETLQRELNAGEEEEL